MAINIERNQSVVKISQDSMRAYLNLCEPDPGQEYNVTDLIEILNKHNVLEGIKRDVLSLILEKKDYYMDFLVAEGTPAVDGTDGSFEFLFNLSNDTKPRILEDGSIDYTSIRTVETVEAGSEIARYSRATQGKDGIDVCGRILKCRQGRELPQLKGKGFNLSEDKLVYKAAITGKAEYANDRLTVSNILIIEGDVNNISGSVEFAGDVEVRGNVITGMTIKARGSIFVNGHVESAQLISGGDVILKNGMQGGGKGEIRAEGEVSGKFFEQTTIYTKGSVKANAILNCYIIAEQEILVSGKRGVIVGGDIRAIRRVEATTIGNVSEVKTKVSAGVDMDTHNHLNLVHDKLDSVLRETTKMEEVMTLINRALENGPNPELSARKMDIMRQKIEKDCVISSLQQEVRSTRIKIDNAGDAKIIVSKNIYRGAKITINGVTKILETDNYNVFYVKEDGEIACKQNF